MIIDIQESINKTVALPIRCLRRDEVININEMFGSIV